MELENRLEETRVSQRRQSSHRGTHLKFNDLVAATGRTVAANDLDTGADSEASALRRTIMVIVGGDGGGD